MLLGYTEVQLRKSGGLVTAKEIRQQPGVWMKLYQILLGKKNDLTAFLNNIRNQKDIKIILAGAGTSAFVGESSKGYLKRMLGVEVEAIDTTDIVAAPEDFLYQDRPTLLISHARSGNSPESLATITLAEKLIKNVYFLNIMCNKEGDLAKYTNAKKNHLNIFMPEEANDAGFAMTSSFTCMLLTDLMLPHINEIENKKALFKKLASEAERILTDDSSNIEKISKNGYDRLIFLGSSDLKGCAKEAALKSLELSNGIVNTSFNTCLGFRHGPKAAINNTTLLGFFVSNHPYTQRYDIDLIKEIVNEPGNRQIAVFLSEERNIEGVNYIFTLKEDFKDIDGSYLSLLYIIYAQMLAFYKSLNLGITPDNPNPEGRINRVVKGVKIYEY
jgi:tagatose-6-phosphate ketose/aldose isomerase